MKETEFISHLDELFESLKQLHKQGSSEYAKDENMLDNFERIGAALGRDPEETLMVYLLKHIDGISAWVRGHRSQRERVTGRIEDAMMYLAILHAMVHYYERLSISEL